MNTPLLSLVVLSFNNFDTTTGPCLASLLHRSPICGGGSIHAPLTELILVDNGSQDGAAAQCAQFVHAHPSTVFLPQAENMGFGGGMNAGVATASGHWVCLVNSDTLFPPGALAALHHTLQNIPDDVAMVGPVSNAAGNGQCLALPGVPMRAVAAIGEQAMAAPIGALIPTYRTDFFCVAIRRNVWQELNGLDPVFGLGYFEDFDFSLRLAKAGYKQVIAEDVFVAHIGSASFAKQRTEQRQLLKRNRALLLQRHPTAKLEHLRVGNVQALAYLMRLAAETGWSSGLSQRAAWRLANLIQDEPRSLFKRWRWRWSHRVLRKTLAAMGVVAGFPQVSI
jgi:GT2 family glycosyltransferase